MEACSRPVPQEPSSANTAGRPGLVHANRAAARTTTNGTPMTSAKTFAAAAPPRFASIGSPYFGIMLAVMAVVLILSNIGASKGVALGPIVTDGVFFLFPLAYILGDVISEVYGFTVARKAIVTSFALSVFASLCYWIIIVLPGFDAEYGAAKQSALEGALGPVPQIVLASTLAFLAGQTLTSWIIVKMKARTGE